MEFKQIYNEFADSFNEMAEQLEDVNLDVNELIALIQKYERVVRYGK
jgi:hypothetical protein